MYRCTGKLSIPTGIARHPFRQRSLPGKRRMLTDAGPSGGLRYRMPMPGDPGHRIMLERLSDSGMEGDGKARRRHRPIQRSRSGALCARTALNSESAFH